MGTGGAVVSSCGARAGRGEALCACGGADAGKAHLPHLLGHLPPCRVGGTWGCRPGLRVGDMSPLPNTMSKRAPGAPPRAWPAAAGARTASKCTTAHCCQ